MSRKYNDRKKPSRVLCMYAITAEYLGYLYASSCIGYSACSMYCSHTFIIKYIYSMIPPVMHHFFSKLGHCVLHVHVTEIGENHPGFFTGFLRDFPPILIHISCNIFNY